MISDDVVPAGSGLTEVVGPALSALLWMRLWGWLQTLIRLVRHELRAPASRSWRSQPQTEPSTLLARLPRKIVALQRQEQD